MNIIAIIIDVLMIVIVGLIAYLWHPEESKKCLAALFGLVLHWVLSAVALLALAFSAAFSPLAAWQWIFPKLRTCPNAFSRGLVPVRNQGHCMSKGKYLDCNNCSNR